MNENLFTLLTRWRNRAEDVPRLAVLSTRLLRFVVLLCIGLYGQNLNAQCVDCSNVTGIDITVDCAEAIPSPEDLLIINPSCASGATTITFADVVVNATTVTRTYTYGPTGETCSHDITVTAGPAAAPTISCPNNVIEVLDEGQCEKIVFLAVPAVTNACGFPMDVIVTSAPTLGLASGSAFPIGTTTLTYTVFGFDGAVPDLDICTVDVTINEFSGTVSTLGCQNFINLSTAEGCEVLITPNMVLGNGNYLCEDNYTVTVIGLTPASAITTVLGGVLIDATLLDGFATNGISSAFNVMVTDNSNPTTNSCWAEGWTIEDKMAPTICCSDFSISCIDPTDPTELATNGEKETYVATTPVNIPIPATNSSFSLVEIPIEVFDCPTPVIDVDVVLEMGTSSLGEYAAELVHPDGTVVSLFNRPDNGAATPVVCTTTGLVVLFNDEATQTHADFQTACEPSTGNITGSFISASVLSAFDTKPAGGTWILRVYSYGAVTNNITRAELIVEADFAHPFAQDDCTTVTTSMADEIVGTICDGQQILRTWTVTDANSRTDVCTQTITIVRPTLDDIVCPLNWNGETGEMPVLSCAPGSFDLDVNGHPSPTHTGVPTYNDLPINGLCMFNFADNNGLPYSDVIFPGSCSGNVTYKRTWMILDMCTGVMIPCVQTIKVVDTDGPTITCPTYATVGVGTGCVGNVNLDAPPMTDDCDATTNLTYTATTTGGTLIRDAVTGIYNLSNLAVGTSYVVTYIGSDGCGNTSTCTSTIDVADLQGPSVSCTSLENLTLNNFGTATINAQTQLETANGNSDNCGIVTYEVRLPSDCSTVPQTTFASSVGLGCCHAGTDVVVEFRVTDAAGNSNTCSTTIAVSPYADFGFTTCPTPANTTLECNDIAGDLATIGLTNVVQTPTVIEVSHTDISGVTNQTAGYYPVSGVRFNGCGTAAVSIVDIDNSTSCGLGNVTRTYTVTSGSQTSTCVVVFDVENNQLPFDLTTIVLNDATVQCTDITSQTNPDPSQLPMNQQGPIISSLISGCQDVQVMGYTNNILTPAPADPGVCTKILRTFTIWDECAAVSVERVQLIKIMDPGPTFTGCPGVENLTIGETSATVVTATDVCGNTNTPVSYAIDLNSDGGTPDAVGTGGDLSTIVGMVGGANFPIGSHTVTFSASGCNITNTCSVVINVNFDCTTFGALLNPAYNLNVGDISGSGTFDPTITDMYAPPVVPIAGISITKPDGSPATFTCADLDKNIAPAPTNVDVVFHLPGGVACPVTMRITDSSSPSITCNTPLQVNIEVGDTGVGGTDIPRTIVLTDVSVVASDEAACTATNLLTYTFSPATVSCADLGNLSTVDVPVIVTVSDGYTSAVCTNSVTLVSASGAAACGSTPPSANVVGSISNESNSMLENVTVTPASGMDVSMTDINGTYNLNLATNENYNVTPEKDDDYLNGVSTYDIVLMSKHILQIDLLDSPYKMIAADVNKSGGITTLDMVELRKVILFINDEFSNNSSWRFVDANYAFPDTTNPFGEIFPESYAINGLTGDMEDLDFVAVKIGDVNGTAVTNGFSGDSDSRDFNGTLELEMKDVHVKAGQTHTIEVKANDFNNMLGYQFTMAFDGLEVTDVTPGELTSLTTANFGMQRLQEGMLTTSWNSTDAVSLADGA
ncbi:MAG: hypothetical protein ACI8YQ_003309, partial [Polaribacter sp.]